MLPLRLCYSPSNYSPFLTKMAKETRIVRIPNLNPLAVTGPSSCYQFETRVQWFGLVCRWIELRSVACGILAYHTSVQPLQIYNQDDQVPVYVLEKRVVQCPPYQMWNSLFILPCLHLLLHQHCLLGFKRYQQMVRGYGLCFGSLFEHWLDNPLASREDHWESSPLPMW